MNLKSKYDYIIVGAGSAGCVIANRLSANPDCSVLLVEAGGHDRNPLFRLPILMGKLFQSGIYNWRYYTDPVPTLNNRSLYWPRGKVLGGSSTINGMLYVRGNQHDYDRWAQNGLPGWSYDDVLPAFRRSESHLQRDDEYHSTDGELTVCRARGSNILNDTFIKAGGEAGHPITDDFNGKNQEGFGRYDFNIKKGKRWSASSAFLHPVSDRPNLTITTDATTLKVNLERNRATGVDLAIGRNKQTVWAAREVIISAGTVNSPQILMLSGIGPVDELSKHGIAVACDLPGVGKNLQDHVDSVLSWECSKPVTLYKDMRADKLAWSIIQGTLFGEGIATTFPYESGAFLKSHADLMAPDIQYHFMPALEKTANLYFPNPFKREAVEANHGFTVRVGPVNPTSRGFITLRSSNPGDAPVIQPNYLSSNFDKKIMISAIRMLRNVVKQPAFDAYRGPELAPGKDIDSDNDLLTWLRETAMTTFHPVGTCKMGIGPDAVVDARLKVHGIEGLRVADASIMPIISSGNTHAPAVMIGEKLVEFINAESGEPA
jgi:choline dehydrogenase